MLLSENELITKDSNKFGHPELGAKCDQLLKYKILKM